MPLALIVVTTVLAHAAFTASRLTLSLNALSLGASPLAIGVMMSLFAAFPMALSVAAGRLVDRVGVRRPIMAAGACLAASVALPAAFPGLTTLFIAAVGIGTSFMMFHIAVQHAVGEGSGEAQRRSNFGLLALGFSISNFIGPTSAGVAIDQLGHRATFALASCFALAAVGLLALRRHSLTHKPPAETDRKRRSALELLRNRELRRAFMVTALLASAWDLFVFVMPIYGTSIGLSASTIGLILGSFALATILIRVALPVISRHLREWQMITTTMGIACVAYALFPLMDSVALLASIAFLLGLGLGATQPSIMTLIYAAAPPGRGAEAVGMRSVVMNTSHAILPLAFGGVGAALGMTPVFWSMSLALAAGGYLADRQRRAERVP